MITDPLFYAAAVPAVILLGLAKGGFSGIGVLAVPPMTLAVSPARRVHRHVCNLLRCDELDEGSRVRCARAVHARQPGHVSRAVSAAVGSTIVGAKLIRSVAPDRFYKLVYVLLILTGLKLTWDGAVGSFHAA